MSARNVPPSHACHCSSLIGWLPQWSRNESVRATCAASERSAVNGTIRMPSAGSTSVDGLAEVPLQREEVARDLEAARAAAGARSAARAHPRTP